MRSDFSLKNSNFPFSQSYIISCFSSCTSIFKKNLNASRPSEHPIQMVILGCFCLSLLPSLIMYVVSVLFLLFVWCPCMVISVSVQCNGGHLPDIILLTMTGEPV